MSERGFQKALIHLFTTIDSLDAYSEAYFRFFDLSGPELESLRELIAFQHDGLLVFHNQLREKRRRAILDGLPRSRVIASDRLEILLAIHMSSRPHEGACDPANAVRSFAVDLGSQLASDPPSKELEFIWFEALCASVALPRAAAGPGAARPSLPGLGLRLSLSGDAALAACIYDLCPVMTDPSVERLSGCLRKPGWFFLFQAPDGELRVVRVAVALAHVLKMFLSGLSMGEVLQALARETERTEAAASVEKLLGLGAPFYTGQ